MPRGCTTSRSLFYDIWDLPENFEKAFTPPSSLIYWLLMAVSVTTSYCSLLLFGVLILLIGPSPIDFARDCS
jgi:hypothetical protein